MNDKSYKQSSTFSPETRRTWLLGGSIVVAAILYATLFAFLYRGAPNSELVFAEAGTVPPLSIYLDAEAMEPVREALRVRLDFTDNIKTGGKPSPGLPSEDVLVQVWDGRSSMRKIAIDPDRAPDSVTMEFDLIGSIGNYPLDRHTGHIAVNAWNKTTGVPYPVRMTIWPVLTGWTLAIERASSSSASQPGLNLDVRVSRPAPIIAIALALYCAMALVGISGFTIGALVFLGLRPIESTLTSALGAMVFAVPAVRAALPGNPPLGVHADVLAFLWVELAVIVGLGLFVVAWARKGLSR